VTNISFKWTPYPNLWLFIRPFPSTLRHIFYYGISVEMLGLRPQSLFCCCCVWKSFELAASTWSAVGEVPSLCLEWSLLSCCSSLHSRIAAALFWWAVFLTVKAAALLQDSLRSEDCCDLSARYCTPVAGCRVPSLRAASSLSASCRLLQLLCMES